MIKSITDSPQLLISVLFQYWKNITFLRELSYQNRKLLMLRPGLCLYRDFLKWEVCEIGQLDNKSDKRMLIVIITRAIYFRYKTKLTI